MKKTMVGLLLSLLLVVVLVFGTAGAAMGAASEPVAPGRYIVLFDSAVNGASKAKLEQVFGAVVGKDIALLGNANVVWLPPQAVEAFSRHAGVLRVEEDAVVRALAKPVGSGKPSKGEPPPQPLEQLPWGVDRIDADMVWATSYGSGIKVAILDTGIDNNHADVAVAGGVNFVGKGPFARNIDPNKWDDDNGHGTHVAGTVAGLDNTVGVIGVAPGASLYAVKVLDGAGSGYLSNIILGIEWAITNGIDVINMSLGSSSGTQSLSDAVDAAYAAGIVLVAAAGNEDGPVIYPAAYNSVIAVAATDVNDARASWSNYGAQVEVSAPGVSILSTWNDGYYKTISGTSMAAPHVSGTVALLLAANAGLSPAQVRTILQATAEDLGDVGQDDYYGYGLVDAEAAVAGAITITP